MNKGLLIALALVVLSPVVLSAQDVPKAEVYGGYLMVHEENSTGNGFLGAVEGNINKSFGIVGEFGYNAQTQKNFDDSGVNVKFKLYDVLAGPRVSYRTDKFRVFAHALFGYHRLSAEAKYAGYGAESSNDWGMAFGGGVDVSASKLISIRLAQVDWLAVHYNFRSSISGGGEWSNALRYSGGIVFKLGGK